MSELNFEAMPNNLVNYATVDGIAIIELASDASGAPLTETNDRSPNTYTRYDVRYRYSSHQSTF